MSEQRSEATHEAFDALERMFDQMGATTAERNAAFELVSGIQTLGMVSAHAVAHRTGLNADRIYRFALVTCIQVMQAKTQSFPARTA